MIEIISNEDGRFESKLDDLFKEEGIEYIKIYRDETTGVPKTIYKIK